MMRAILSLLIVTLISSAYGQGNGVVRLYSQGNTSSTLTAGKVQVYYNGAWGNICGSNSNYATTANTICYQLGYNGAISYNSNTSYGDDNLNVILTNVNCDSSDQTVLQCNYIPNSSGSCTAGSELSVNCYTTPVWNGPYKARVRLSDGDYVSEGRVEVYCDSWGTICRNGFTQDAANVICRQLGYTEASSYNTLAPSSGNASAPIWMENVECSVSTYTCLAYCQSCPDTAISSSTCSHSNDVNVQCTYRVTSTSYSSSTYTCVDADAIAKFFSWTIGVLVGIIITGIVLCVICIALIIGIPICICCCFGIGIAAASSSRSSRQHVGGTTTTSTISHTEQYNNNPSTTTTHTHTEKSDYPV